ncbi:hypothetical protein [Microvirga roseola]|uniref:hypothetical protein n=1 Tax=Microvirga roseola TaxID=2883126 RepID=UPI001E4CCBB0|nr:hypothetical protein [Microvirga roseola]
MHKRLILAAIIALAAPQVALSAEEALPLCPGASEILAADPLLRSAVRAAYPETRERRGRTRRSLNQPCIYPYRAIPYDDAVVLITLAQVPGTACHGCAADVSAVFLKRDGSTLTPVSRHDSFVQIGTFGDLASIEPFRLGAQHGLMVEGGGTFQGYSSSVMVPFLIQDGQMLAVGPDGGIPGGDSNCGAVVDDELPCREVEGRWRVDGDRLIVHYTGTRGDGSPVDGTVVYELRDGSLVLVSGAEVAAEMIENRP